MSAKHTPGPLSVAVDDSWPFTIRTFNASGHLVFSRDMPAHSTLDTCAADAIRGRHFDVAQRAQVQEANKRAIADEVLRAAAPELLDALQPFVARNSSSEFITITVRTADVAKARAAIAKATGEQA